MLLLGKQLLKIFSMYTLWCKERPLKPYKLAGIPWYLEYYFCCFAAQLNITNIGKYGKRSFSGFSYHVYT